MSFDAADIAAFNDADLPAFALAVVGAVSIAGRFRDTYAEAFGVAGHAPMFEAASADLAAVAQGTAITVNGTGYTVAGIEPNTPRGMTLLRLEKS